MAVVMAMVVPAAVAGRDLNAIHGLAGNNIRVTGELGTLIRWNGTAWSSVGSGAANGVNGEVALDQNRDIVATVVLAKVNDSGQIVELTE